MVVRFVTFASESLLLAHAADCGWTILAVECCADSTVRAIVAECN